MDASDPRSSAYGWCVELESCPISARRTNQQPNIVLILADVSCRVVGTVFDLLAIMCAEFPQRGFAHSNKKVIAQKTTLC
jgi:hypothetical protein